MKNNKDKLKFFLIGNLIGFFLVVGLGAAGLAAFKYYGKGAGLGEVKSLARKIFNKGDE